MDEVLEEDQEVRRVRQEREQQLLETEVKEEQVCGEELEERKNNDIFTQTSTQEFLQALAPETEDSVTTGQRTIEEYLMSGREGYSRPHTNKITKLEPLEPEPKIKIEIPKPQPCEDPLKTGCALDKLAQLDKQHNDKNFGFYGNYFRHSHGRNLNFYKYRKANPVGHPHARLRLMKNKFLIHIVRCILTSQLLRNILIDALLFMVV